MNLFINAIEAMPKGGKLFIQTNQQDNHLTVSIQDTGCGISDKDLPHIFEPLYSTKEKGSGLGLSIVYNIIKEHNGNIKVKNKIREGTELIVELPIEYNDREFYNIKNKYEIGWYNKKKKFSKIL